MRLAYHFPDKYNDGTSKYDQTVSVDGKVVSQLSTSSGKAQGWGTAEECQQAACGTVAAHEYVNTKVSQQQIPSNNIEVDLC